MTQPKYWIPEAIKTKSSLRKKLNVPVGKKIDMSVLEKIKKQPIGTHVSYRGKTHTITRKLKKRAVLAHTLRQMQKKAAK